MSKKEKVTEIAVIILIGLLLIYTITGNLFFNIVLYWQHWVDIITYPVLVFLLIKAPGKAVLFTALFLAMGCFHLLSFIPGRNYIFLTGWKFPFFEPVSFLFMIIFGLIEFDVIAGFCEKKSPAN